MVNQTILSLLVLLFFAASTAHADTIELQDGRKFSGTVSRQGNQATIKTDDGQTITTAWSDIARVSLSGPADASAGSNAISPDQAKSDWTRISAQIKTTPDLQKIIDLHQNFLTKYPDSPVANQVKESLKIYQQLADVKAVRFHGQWMPPNQADALQQQWTEATQPGVALYKAGKFKDALTSAQAVVTKDKENSDALTLAGLAAYQINDLVTARQSFSSLFNHDPSNVLAQHNLAIINFQQKQIDDGLAQYATALSLVPGNPLLLDNITELINAYKNSGGDLKATNFRILSTAFTPAESALEADMAKRGLFRLGSTWATKDELTTAAENTKIVHDQMDDLNARYKSNHDAIAEVELKIKQAYADWYGAADDWSHARDFDAEKFNAMQKAWQSADEYLVRQLVRRFDLRVREVALTTQLGQMKTQLAISQGFSPDKLRLMDAPASKTIAADYVPRPLPAAIAKLPDSRARSTVSKPELEAKGIVKIAYLPAIVDQFGRYTDGTPFFVEVPTEQPGTFAASLFGNSKKPMQFIRMMGSRYTRVLHVGADKMYWISVEEYAAAPAGMPPEYVGTVGTEIPARGFGLRISNTTPIGLPDRTLTREHGALNNYVWNPFTLIR